MENYLMSSPRNAEFDYQPDFDYDELKFQLEFNDIDYMNYSDNGMIGTGAVTNLASLVPGQSGQVGQLGQVGHLGLLAVGLAALSADLAPAPVPDNSSTSSGPPHGGPGHSGPSSDPRAMPNGPTHKSHPSISSDFAKLSTSSSIQSLDEYKPFPSHTTPRKRNKSTSIGSFNLSTPLKTSPSSNSSKISKTPYKHARSLSRNRNQFFTPSSFTPSSFTPSSMVSPKYKDLSFDQEDFETPVQHMPQFNLQFTSPQLRRQNTLESIKIEDQESDAIKQLKRAKSSTSINHPPLHHLHLYLHLYLHLNLNLYQYLAPLLAPVSSQSQAPLSQDPEPNLMANFEMSSSADAMSAAAAANPVSLKNIQLIQSQFSQLKSYPASINLLSIASNKPGLLPPMALFENDQPQSFSAPASTGSSLVSIPKSNFNHLIQSPHQIDEISLKQAKEINPSFVPDLPIKIKDDIIENDPKKKHACPLCLARFQRPEHVKRHMKSHSLEKPFECDQPNCNKRFNRKDNLKAHLKKIHSII